MADPSLEEVDAFLAGYKTLDGYLGQWRQHHGWEWTTQWGIVDASGVQEAELVFTINAALTKPTITALFRKCLIYRVDIVPSSECKMNPYGALALGLPARVCGPHCHGWAENRAFVSANGFGEIPHRKPVEVADQRFIRCLEVAAKELNIHVAPDQRDCEPPRQAALFSERFQ